MYSEKSKSGVYWLAKLLLRYTEAFGGRVRPSEDMGSGPGVFERGCKCCLCMMPG